MKKMLFMFIFVVIGCNKDKNVEIIKQWHLASHQMTNDIEKGKKLPQYKNQKEIYNYLSKEIQKEPGIVLFAEGCEGSGQKAFSRTYNGWNLELLKKYIDKPSFEDIMAPIPMKILAKFPRSKVICGDSDKLIKENLEALSDLRGFTGFYQKLKLFKQTNEKKFKAYKKQLLSIYPKAKDENILKFSLKKAKESLARFETLLKQRNSVFLENVEKYGAKKNIIVIGGLHTLDLETKFRAKGYKAYTKTPTNYSKDESILILGLKSILQNEFVTDFEYFQVPNGFNIKKFPIKNLLKINDVFNNEELSHMKSLIQGKFSLDILLSDFDNDGIRDFTVSTSSTDLILSAEDPDWDNDGVDNIIDVTVGNYQVAEKLEEIRMNNNYLSTKPEKEVLSQAHKDISLVCAKNTAHEQLVLEVFHQVSKRLQNKLKKVKHLVATEPVFNYGQKVFFSYVPQSQSIEYYPKKLNLFLNQEYQLKFKGTDFKKFVNSYIVPVIIHSLSHEFAHVDEPKTYENKLKGWNYQIANYEGNYLRAKRYPPKVVSKLLTSQNYMGKTYKDWLAEYKNFIDEVNMILKLKTKQAQLEKIKASKYRTGLKEEGLEFLLSFLHKHQIPSVYSLKNSREWRAEMFAACFFQNLYPSSKETKASIKYEHLIGFYPLAASEELCRSLKKDL